MTIRLHHCPQTRSMRTLWLLYELGIPFDVIEHAFDKSLRKPTYLAVSPAGRVPALEIDGQSLFETGAIAQYLCEKYSPAILGREVQHPERAQWLVWMHFAETLSQHTAALTQQHVALYDDAMRSSIVMKLEAARVGKCFAALETHFTAGHEFLLDGGFTAADIGVGQAVYMSKYFCDLTPYPATQTWFDRVSSRGAFTKSLPAPGTELYTRDFYPAWSTQ